MNTQQSLQQSQDLYQYLQEMTPLERQAYEIARTHLKTSFNVVRSNGFIEWMKKRK
jgi:hypothetical protein